MLIDKVKKYIDSCDVISFDIFDTLLLRPYVRPTDMFQHLEKVYHKPCFYVCRIEAEENARIMHPELEDITYDMIYDEIDDEFKDMKQKEMDWEEMVLRANPELKQLYNYAKQQGKKIVIASDMYLPTKFIAKVLRKCGYDGWDKLYVSADVNARKGNGSMFIQIMSDLNVSAKQIFHIGDNKISDYKVPQKLKIKAVKYEPIYQQFKKQNKRYLNMDPKITILLGGSIIFSVFAYDWIMKKCKQKAETNNYWFDLGYLYAGPVIYGYTRFVEKQAIKNNIDSLLFVARDGYLLQKVFKTFNSTIKNTYVYAPRVLNHICRLDYVRGNKEQAQYIIDFYAQKNSEIKKQSKDIKNPHEFIQQHKDIFGKLAQGQMDKYRDYLRKNTSKADKYALVDTISGQFSSQKILQEALNQELWGIYWGICQDELSNKYNYRAFVGEHTLKSMIPDKYFFTDKWNFMEFLMTSPEFPIKNIDDDGKPIFKSIENPYEEKRTKLYPDVVNGALNFAKEIKNWFKGNDIYLTSQDIIGWVNLYLERPNLSDIEQMKGLKFGEDSSHENWIPLLVSELGIKDFLKEPKKVSKILEKAMWHTPTQSFLLCCYKPLLIKMRGLTKINIILFPYLKQQYGIFALNISKRWFYKFIIGNMKG